MTRARLAAAGTLVILAALGGGAALAVTSGHERRADDSEPQATSYCDAALEVARADAGDTAVLAPLLDRALALAPSEVRPAIRTMQRSSSSSNASVSARAEFTTFNTDHCCGCIGTGEPVVEVAEPPSAA